VEVPNGLGKAIGSDPIECRALNIENIDCTKFVKSRNDYKPKLRELLNGVCTLNPLSAM